MNGLVCKIQDMLICLKTAAYFVVFFSIFFSVCQFSGRGSHSFTFLGQQQESLFLNSNELYKDVIRLLLDLIVIVELPAPLNWGTAERKGERYQGNS